MRDHATAIHKPAARSTQPSDKTLKLLSAAKLEKAVRGALLSPRYSRFDAPVVEKTQRQTATKRDFEDHMLAYLTGEGRLLGFNGGDWALLLGGFVLIGFVTLLTA
jgi:hypothetical protein